MASRHGFQPRSSPVHCVDRRRGLRRPDRALLRARRRAPRGPRRPREQGPVGLPRVPRARSSAATGRASNREYGFWGGESEEERAAAGFRVDMPVGRVARYPKGNGTPVQPRTPRVAVTTASTLGRRSLERPRLRRRAP